MSGSVTTSAITSIVSRRRVCRAITRSPIAMPTRPPREAASVSAMTVTITAPRQKKRSHVGCFVRSR